VSGTVSNLGVRRPECNNWGGVLADRTATVETRVEFIVRVETRLAGKTLAVEEVEKFDCCASGVASEEIGLTLPQGKDVLKQVQRNIVQTQIRVQNAASSRCMHCGGTLLVKDIRGRQIRTVFGKIKVACRRYIRCTCRGGRPSILWPLGLMELPGSTPELDYLLAKWGSILPYRRAAEMLGELLPDIRRRCGISRDASPPCVGGRCASRSAGDGTR
jgi:hypothetical protein